MSEACVEQAPQTASMAMPTTAHDKIRARQERLKESMQAAVEAVRQSFLAQGAAIIEAQREMEQGLEEGLREGLEREVLLGTLATVRSEAERAAQWFGTALAILEDDAQAGATLRAQRQQAEVFLASMRGLEARVTAIPPFDESRLAPVPDGPVAAGYLNVSAARARLRGGKSP